jgi:hypothetical protein
LGSGASVVVVVDDVVVVASVLLVDVVVSPDPPVHDATARANPTRAGMRRRVLGIGRRG